MPIATNFKKSFPTFWIGADAIEIEIVRGDFDIQGIFQGLLDKVDSRVTKLHNGLTAITDKMVMLLLTIGFFVDGSIIVQIMPDHYSRFDK